MFQLATILANASTTDDVSVSIGGLILGLLIGALVYVFGDWAAKETGAAVLRIVGAIVAVVVFVVLGFDFH